MGVSLPSLRRALLLLLGGLACAPPAAVDRATLSDATPAVSAGDAPSDRPDQDGAGAAGGLADGGAGGSAGMGGAARDAAPDRSPPSPGGADAARLDRTPLPDLLVRTDTPVPRDAAPEAPRTMAALLVVGDANAPTAGDMRIRTVLAVKGLAVRLASETAAVDVTGVDLVVLASSSAANDLTDKYRTVPLPLLNLESAVFPAMGMTAAVRGTDQGEDAATQLTVLMPGHPLAAGLTGTITVVDPMATITWGLPAASAERIAVLAGMNNRVAIYGYRRQAMMVSAQAPARRVGFFASDQAAANLTDNGVRLLAAAIDWALAPD
jgi:hypothetical protein